MRRKVLEKIFPQKGKEIFYEVILFYLLSLMLLQITGFLRTNLPLFDKISPFFTSAIFILLPIYIIRKNNLSIINYGANPRGLLKDILMLIVISLIVFSFFVPGFFIYNSVILNLKIVKGVNLFKQWAQDIYEKPSQFKKNGVYIWIDDEELFVLSKEEKTIKLDIKLEGLTSTKVSGLILKDEGLYYVNPKLSEGILKTELVKDNGIKIDLLDTEKIEIISSEDKTIFFEGMNENLIIASQIVFKKNFLNLFFFIIFQIFLVGIPEEFFYRGYMQGRLNDIFPRKWKFAGVYFGLSIIWTSILFAFGHFIMEPFPHRFMVFFPSLLFGWIRERSNGIYGAGIFHALCNIVLYILQRFY